MRREPVLCHQNYKHIAIEPTRNASPPARFPEPRQHRQTRHIDPRAAKRDRAGIVSPDRAPDTA